MADSLLQEVDQALRADRASALWQKHRKTLLTIAAGLILGTAANSLWQHQREVKGGEMLQKLTEAQQLLEKGNAPEAAKAFGAIAAGAKGEFKDLALVWQSRALVKAEKKTEAATVLAEAVKDGQSLWADIACLRLAGLDAKAAEPCLAAKNKTPLAATRAEWAAANSWANGDVLGAKAAIEALLADANTAPDASARLTEWLAVIKAQEGQK